MIIHTLARTVLTGLLMLTLGVSGAFAHASLLTTTPANNDVLSAPPSEVRMNFNEPVGILSFVLLGPDGRKHDLTSVTNGGNTVTVPMPNGLPQGTEALTWHIVSADGHPVAGTLVFSIGTITGSVDQAQTDRLLAVAIWLARVLVYVGLFIGAGSLIFGAITALPNAARRISFALIGVGAVAAVVSIGLQGVDGLGLTLDGLLDPHAWATGWSTTYTLTIIAILVAYILAVVSTFVPAPARVVVAILALVGTGLSLALSGHASAADPQWLARPTVFLHVSAVCFWIGSLMPIGLLLLTGGPDAEKALERFSAIIPWALLPLVIAGGTLAIVQLGPFGEAWLTPYAAILGCKLVIVLVLFVLGAWNRWRLTKPVLEGSDRGRRRLALSVRAEIVCVLLILGLAAGWRFTVPPRAIAQELAVPAKAQMMVGNLMANVTILPGRVGETRLSVSLMDMQMAPVTPLSVKVSLQQKTAGVGPIEADATMGSDRLWHADHVEIPISGTWTVSIDARTGIFDITTLTGTLEIQ